MKNKSVKRNVVFVVVAALLLCAGILAITLPNRGPKVDEGNYYAEEIAETIKSVKKLTRGSEPCLVFPMVTDIHYLKSEEVPESFDYCIANKLLFQTANYNNALFVGYDSEGKPRYGALRSTFSAYKSEATGSDKRYSFSIATNPTADTVHVFESAIDLLSYATLQLYEGGDWKNASMLSLAGVFAPKRQGVVPVALSRFLSENPNIKTLRLHLNNDEVGCAAAAGIIEGLTDYTVVNEPPACGKDVNEQLQMKVGLTKKKEDRDR